MSLVWLEEDPRQPGAIRIRLQCDLCRERILNLHVQGSFSSNPDYGTLLAEAVRGAARDGWLWTNPQEITERVTCQQCQLQEAIANLPGCTLTSQQIVDLSQTDINGTIVNTEVADFIREGVQPSDRVFAVSDTNALVAHPDDVDRFREAVAHMIQEVGGDPYYQVFAREDVNRAGLPRLTDPWSVDVPRGRHVVGLDPAMGEDTSVAQVVIDGKVTGQTIRLRRDMKSEPVRKSKWDRLMEDDDEPCP